MAPKSLTFLNLNWWRRRESNPRPQIVPLSFYMLSRHIVFACKDFHRRNSLKLAHLKFSSAKPWACVAALPEFRRPGLPSGQDFPGASLMRLERSRNCRHLMVFLPVLRADRTSACNLKFPIYVEAVSPPHKYCNHSPNFCKSHDYHSIVEPQQMRGSSSPLGGSMSLVVLISVLSCTRPAGPGSTRPMIRASSP